MVDCVVDSKTGPVAATHRARERERTQQIGAQTVIGLLLAAAVVGAIAVASIRYARKRRVDRAVHRQHAELRHERQLELEHSARLEAQKCESSAQVCRILSQLVDDAVDSMRAGVGALESGEPYVPSCSVEGGRDGCQSHVELIERLLFDVRAVLPPSVFGVMHDVRTASVAFEATARGVTDRLDAAARAGALERARGQLTRVESAYEALLDQVHDFLGVCACTPAEPGASE